MRQARALWISVHRWLALTVGALVAIVSLTGGVLAFHPELERALNPQLDSASDAPLSVTPDEAVAAVTNSKHVQPALLWPLAPDQRTYTIESYDPATDTFWITSIDGVTGRILGHRQWGRTFTTFLLQFHATLLFEDTGLRVVSLLGAVLLVSALTGLYLWWPRQLCNRRAYLPRLSRTPLVWNYETHRLLGLYLLPVIAVIAFAGLSFGFPEQFATVVGWFSPVDRHHDAAAPQSQPPAPDTPRISLAQVEQIAAHAFPGARHALFTLPQGSLDAYGVDVFAADEPASRHGLSTLWIDAYSGTVLQRHAYATSTTGERFMALQLPLHAGIALGLPGKIVASLAGVVIFVLYVTGLTVWWKRRALRKSQPVGQ